MTAEPVCVASTGCMLGEGPLWSPTEQLLWWVDIRRAKLHRYNPATENSRRYDLPIRASAIALHHGGFIMVGDREGGLYDPSTEAYERKFVLEHEPSGVRTNDGGAAPDGSFWFGVMDDSESEVCGRYYRVAPDFSVSQLMLPPVMVTNTFRFSPDNKIFYTCDSAEQEIFAHDYDAITGALTDRRVFATTDDGGGYPDGSAVDSDGYLWNAQWDAARVVRYRPDGQIDRIVDMPVARPTSCAFGGKGLGTLFITTARVGLSEDALEEQPFAGGLFALDVDTPGAPQRVFGDA